MPTRYTSELGLGTAIRLLTVTTNRTGAACVARINRDNHYTLSLGLVIEKFSQLEEPPIVAPPSLRLPNRCPRANARQILDDYRTLRVFGFRNNPLTDAVVLVSLKPGLSSRKLSQASFGRFRADFLQDCTAGCVPLTPHFHNCSCKDLPVTVGCQVDDAHINTQCTAYNLLRLLNCIIDYSQIPFSSFEYQQAFTLSEGKQFMLKLAACKLYGLPSIDRPDRDSRGTKVERENLKIKSNCAQWLKGAQSSVIQFVRVCDLRNTTHCHLRRQPKSISCIVINLFMQGELLKCFCLPRNLTNTATCGVRLYERAPKGISLRWCGHQFDSGCKFHRTIWCYLLIDWTPPASNTSEGRAARSLVYTA